MVSTRATKRREGGATAPAPKVDYTRDPLKEYLSDDSADDGPLRFTKRGRIHSVEVKPDSTVAGRAEAPAQQGARALAGTPLNQVAGPQPQRSAGPIQNNNQAFGYHAAGPFIPFAPGPLSIYPNMANTADAYPGPWVSGPAGPAASVGPAAPVGHAAPAGPAASAGPAGPADPAAAQGFATFNDGLQPVPASMILPSMPQEGLSHGLADFQGNGPDQFVGYGQGPDGSQMSANDAGPSASASSAGSVGNVNQGIDPHNIALNENPAPAPGNVPLEDLYLDAAYTVDALAKVQRIVERFPMEMRPMNAYTTVMQVFLARAMAQKGLVPDACSFRINRSMLVRIDHSRPVDQCMMFEGRWLEGGPQGPGWYRDSVLRFNNSEYGIDMLIVLEYNQTEFQKRMAAAADAAV